MMEDEPYERLSALAERYAKINGMNEKEILQLAVTAASKKDIEEKLQFLEKQIVQLEKGLQEQKEEKSRHKQVFISDEEHKKCRKVADAYADELDDIEIAVADAGKFGFIKLLYYKFPYGFDDAILFTDSNVLFLDLWEEWFEAQLLRYSKGTPMQELDYEVMFKCLPKEKQEELMAKREYFAKRAEIEIN